MYLREHFNRVRETLSNVNNDAVFAAAEILKTAKENGGTVFVCGNGGSAATASHFANDLIKMANLKTICLNDMMPTVLAFMNDHGVETMFERPFTKLVNRGDVFIAISCSGNSINVLKTMESALLFSCSTILLTGDDGGDIKKYADVTIKAPYPDIRVQEDVHLAVCHALAGVLGEKWD
jgi:D-sedoheptulose 7-phosphate isomerase